jgi:hypothetical protein
MWTARTEETMQGRARRFVIEQDAKPLTYEQVLQLWRGDAPFRSFFGKLLADANFSAFRFETPPITNKTVSRAFEFVLLLDPGLASRPDAQTFAEQFDDLKEIVVFSNLGKDAILVVPCPKGPASDYGHLAAFLRGAPESQQQALWQEVANAMAGRLGSKPVWLSTAGAGVSWLHVRLDDRPKYYGYSPYRVG